MRVCHVCVCVVGGTCVSVSVPSRVRLLMRTTHIAQCACTHTRPGARAPAHEWMMSTTVNPKMSTWCEIQKPVKLFRTFPTLVPRSHAARRGQGSAQA